MKYRQSEMYNRAKYLKNLPLQSVSSRMNLQVVDKFRKCASFFYTQGGNVMKFFKKSVVSLITEGPTD